MMGSEIFSFSAEVEDLCSLFPSMEEMEKSGAAIMLGEDVAWGAVSVPVTIHSDSEGNQLSPSNSPTNSALDEELDAIIQSLQEDPSLNTAEVTESSDGKPILSPSAHTLVDHEYEMGSRSPASPDDSAVRVPNAPLLPPLKIPAAPKRPTSIPEIMEKVKRRRVEAAMVERSPSPAPSTRSYGTSNSKQAQYAKEYRAANKKKMWDMEQRIRELETANADLSRRLATKEAAEKDMKEEIGYLNEVLRRDSQLASVVGGLQQTLGGRLLIPAPTASEKADKDSAKKEKVAVSTRSSARLSSRAAQSSSSTTGGLCLHVQDAGVSVELCKSCASNSRSGQRLLPLQTLNSPHLLQKILHRCHFGPYAS